MEMRAAIHHQNGDDTITNAAILTMAYPELT